MAEDRLQPCAVTGTGTAWAREGGSHWNRYGLGEGGREQSLEQVRLGRGREGARVQSLEQVRLGQGREGGSKGAVTGTGTAWAREGGSKGVSEEGMEGARE